MEIENIFPHPVWRPQTDPLNLDNNALHVWASVLDLEQEQLARLNATLNDEERARAARFRFPKDSHRFIAARGILRDILARYLNVQPAEIQFEYGEHGKPALRAARSISFNVSHSHGAALFAVTYEKRVGVDIEKVREDIGKLEIARRFFSANEAAALTSLPEDERTQAFFRGWTRKEAYIKAIGGGIALLQEFEVSLIHNAPAVLRCGWDEKEPERWSMYDLSPSPQYAAAVAAEWSGHDVQRLRWSESL